MKISSIPQIYRNVNRWTEILSVLSKYGLADWISQLNLDFAKGIFRDREGEALAHKTREVRIRLALSELGPTFIKLGQLLGTRPDLVGVALADELKRLQTDAPADPPEVVREIVESELGQPLEELFAEFDDSPLASASIGQVHRARLYSGEDVVVKVQHRGIQEKVREDLDILSGLAQLSTRIPEFAPYRPVQTVAEFQRALRRELDFGREERNLQQFAVEFAKNPNVRIPRPFSDLCTPRVLTMDMLDGIKISDVAHLRAAGVDLDEVARNGAQLYLHMIFDTGLFHADPHPGNILLLDEGVIGLLDFGMVARLDERLREDMEEMLLAIVQRDPDHLTSLIIRIGDTPPDLDESALSADVADFISHYGNQPLDRFDLSGALNEMTEMIRRYQIMLPAQVAMLLKTLVTLEGTARLLSPQFNLVSLLGTMQSKVLLRRLSPARQLRKVRRFYLEMERLAEIVPRRFVEILRQIQTGQFDVHLDHRGLEPSVNRLVLGMLASALFLGSSWMMSNNVPPVLFRGEGWPFGLHDISILGLSGCVVSIMLGLWLLRAINKSGHLERRDDR